MITPCYRDAEGRESGSV